SRRSRRRVRDADGPVHGDTQVRRHRRHEGLPGKARVRGRHPAPAAVAGERRRRCRDGRRSRAPRHPRPRRLGVSELASEPSAPQTLASYVAANDGLAYITPTERFTWRDYDELSTAWAG